MKQTHTLSCLAASVLMSLALVGHANANSANTSSASATVAGATNAAQPRLKNAPAVKKSYAQRKAKKRHKHKQVGQYMSFDSNMAACTTYCSVNFEAATANAPLVARVTDH